MRSTTHKKGHRAKIAGEIVAAREVPDPMNPDERIWKAQVKVSHAQGTIDAHADLDLCDRVEITFPVKPTIGADVKFTATRHEAGEGRSLSNPRGIAYRREVDANWFRIGG